MYKEKEVKKVCGFYVSNMHFITMILPYLSKQTEENKNIITFFQKDFSKEIKTILARVNISKENKEKIENLDWNKKRITEGIEKLKDDSIIIIGGTTEYVEKINKNLAKTNQNDKITIINCYEINEEQYNIKKIIEKYNYLINTKGIREKENVFKEKNVAN